MSAPLWTVEAMAAAMARRAARRAAATVTGLSIDTPHARARRGLLRLKAMRATAMTSSPAALDGQGRRSPSSPPTGARSSRTMRRCSSCPTCSTRLRDLARAARARTSAKVIGVTGSVGKTSTKEALRLALSTDGETHASAASYNNHWGVPLSLARCPRTRATRVFEIGMNHAGEIAPLTRLVRAACRRSSPRSSRCISNSSARSTDRRRQGGDFPGLEPGGAAVINRDNPQFARLRAPRQGGRRRRIVVVRRARQGRCAARSNARCIPTARPCRRASSAPSSPTSSARRAAMSCINSLAVLARSRWSAPISRWRRWRSPSSRRAGRGARDRARSPGGAALLIDESYNANPASIGRRWRLLGQAPIGPRGRRIAVLGDMLELGPTGRRCIAASLEPVDRQRASIWCSAAGR